MPNKGTGRESKVESDIMKEFIVNSVDLKVENELGITSNIYSNPMS